MNINLMNGDCLELMKTIESGSVDLILTDPPYGTMNTDGGKRLGINGWDMVIDKDLMWSEINRVLRKNGKCILFSQEPFTSDLIKSAIPNVPFLYRCIWIKDRFANGLGAKKAPVNYFEDICVFSKKHTKHDFKGTHPLRTYFANVLEFIGKPKSDLIQTLGNRIDHCTRVNSTQFALCTESTYNELIQRYGINKMQGFRQYKDLEEVNAVYRADLIERMAKQAPMVFNLDQGAKSKSNVFQYKKDYSGYHPTQKPVELLEDLIKTYSNEGDMVLDFTAGSMSTAIACINTNRKGIMIEKDSHYFKVGSDRVSQALHERSNNNI